MHVCAFSKSHTLALYAFCPLSQEEHQKYEIHCIMLGATHLPLASIPKDIERPIHTIHMSAALPTGTIPNTCIFPPTFLWKKYSP